MAAPARSAVGDPVSLAKLALELGEKQNETSTPKDTKEAFKEREQLYPSPPSSLGSRNSLPRELCPTDLVDSKPRTMITAALKSYGSPCTRAPAPNVITTSEQAPTSAVFSSLQPPLPSLFRYIDNHLMRTSHLHNSPPSPIAICPICQYQHNLAPIQTTFLPLSPCGHWVHYRCFIWHTTRLHQCRDKCPCCGVQLFKWDGINVLTLAMRTGIEMVSNSRLHT